jgi:acyl-CoA reductase-like NAD-dependent aldehyde dehydrogenase
MRCRQGFQVLALAIPNIFLNDMEVQARKIRAAVIDGRAQSPRHIQKQLAKLYATLQRARPDIHDAICQDFAYSSTEADAEIFLALKAVKKQYEAFNLGGFIDQEYSLAHGKDNSCRRIPIGCVYIIPSHHSQFYSIIQPACVSIAAGNCVIVQVRGRMP